MAPTSRTLATSGRIRCISLTSWNFFRQMKNLQHVLGSGGPEFLRRSREHRKAGKAYYPLPDMAGMAEG